MREGIHPEYYQATVTCNWVTHLLPVLPNLISMWRSVPSVIHSTLDSRKWQQPADVLISSIVNMVSANKIAKSKVEVRSNLNLFLIKPKDVKY